MLFSSDVVLRWRFLHMYAGVRGRRVCTIDCLLCACQALGFYLEVAWLCLPPPIPSCLVYKVWEDWGGESGEEGHCVLYVHLLRFFGWCSTVVVPLYCRLPAFPWNRLALMGFTSVVVCGIVPVTATYSAGIVRWRIPTL